MRSGGFLVFAMLLIFINLVAGDGVKGKKWGVCPEDDIRCFVEDPPQCQKDWDCPGIQKCCYYHCGLKCVTPVKTLEEGDLFPSS